MAIYRNENVNSLPEQVQENKDNIKQINEIIENIDPEQVATILSDIQALKAEQVVQNTAIGSNTQNIGNNTTAIENEKTTRESVVGVNSFGNTYLKTATANKQIFVENDGLISLKSNNSNITITAPEEFARLETDNSSVHVDETNGVVIATNNTDVSHTIVLKHDGEFQVNNGHYLKFDNTGALTIDGQPVGGGGGAQLYEHNILISVYNADDSYLIDFIIINESNSALGTWAEISNELNSEGYNATNRYLNANGGGKRSTNVIFVYGVYHVTTTGYIKFKYMNIDGTMAEAQLPISSLSIIDNVHAL